jgi:hypothetical protein
MHSGLIPAVSLEVDTEDYSEYFFWLFRPEINGGVEDEGRPESFRDDTLLIWLNGEIVFVYHDISVCSVQCVVLRTTQL